MISYSDFQLTEQQINRIKKHNAEKSIRKYIREHGEAPADIEQYYTISDNDVEIARRVAYSHYLIKEKENAPRPEDLVEVALNLSVVEDGENNTRFGAKRGGDNEEYQYEYWSILIRSTDKVLRGNFTSLSGVTVTLDTRYDYTFYFYLRKSNTEYTKMKIAQEYDGTDIFSDFDNTFHEVNYVPYLSYKTQEGGFAPTQKNDKEYLGHVIYHPSPGKKVTGNVYTFNPVIYFPISGFNADSGIISLWLADYHAQSMTPSGNNITHIWYENGEMQISGPGELEYEFDTMCFKLVRGEIASELIMLWDTRQDITTSNPWYPTIGKGITNPSVLCCRIEKENCVPNEKYVPFDIYRNERAVCILQVPEAGTEVDTGIDVGVIDD